jgi:hypothetical protein
MDRLAWLTQSGYTIACTDFTDYDVVTVRLVPTDTESGLAPISLVVCLPEPENTRGIVPRPEADESGSAVGILWKQSDRNATIRKAAL